MREITIGTGQMRLLSGDITQLGRHIGVMVCPASEDLRPGGGVSGAIHSVGGMEIAVECRWLGQATPGTAVPTTAGRLDADMLVHAVGPVWQGGRWDEDRLLASAYRASLELAEGRGLSSIAFPSISTDAFGFPLERAATIAIGTVAAFLKRATVVNDVMFVLASDDELLTFTRCVDRWERLQASRAAQSQSQAAAS
ncbi:MAG: macro domain-containing protein [Chloroflexota bacterium]